MICCHLNVQFQGQRVKEAGETTAEYSLQWKQLKYDNRWWQEHGQTCDKTS